MLSESGLVGRVTSPSKKVLFNQLCVDGYLPRWELLVFPTNVYIISRLLKEVAPYVALRKNHDGCG